MAFELLEPWDGTRGDLQAGIIASTIANVNRGKNTAAYKPSQFMPTFGPPVKQGPEQIRRVLEAMVIATKGKVKETPPNGANQPQGKQPPAKAAEKPTRANSRCETPPPKRNQYPQPRKSRKRR